MTFYEGHSHSFDVGIAKALGLNAAVVFNHILYWLKINASKGNNLQEGKVWMYETQQQISDFLDYMSLEEVKKSIVKLLDSGILIKGNFNTNKFDQTAWYTTQDQSILKIKKSLTKAPIGAMQSAQKRDGKRRTAPCIYKDQEEQQEEQQQEESASPPVAALFKSEKKHKIHECLESIDIPYQSKQKISSDYDSDTVRNAIEWSTDIDNTPTKSLVASIAFACKHRLSKSDISTPKKTSHEIVSQLFKNGGFYNEAECFLDKKSIAFSRGMKHAALKIDKFFTMKALLRLCEQFGIKIDV